MGWWRNKNCKYGVVNECRECRNNKQRAINNPINTDPSITKVCTKCGRKFPATAEKYFTKFKGGQYKIRAECKYGI